MKMRAHVTSAAQCRAARGSPAMERSKTWRKNHRSASIRSDAGNCRGSDRANGSEQLRCFAVRFEAAGVEFIDENGGGPGVRLRGRETSKKRT